jgi:hypothetical protein
MTKKKPVEEHKTRIKRIEEEAKNSVWHRIKELETRKEKVELVQSTNPLLYVFGGFLMVWKEYEDYQTNMNRLYLGKIKGE